MSKKHRPLTDLQWQVIAPLLNLQRKRAHDLREVFNAILFIARTGVQWCFMPACYPPMDVVYYYFDLWKKSGLLRKLNLALNILDRVRVGRPPKPSLLLIDSQSVKLDPRISEHRGLDAFKKVNGRKRQIITDSEGRIFAVLVHAANLHDGAQAITMLKERPAWASEAKLVLSDRGYLGRFADHLKALGIGHQVASRPPSKKGFVPIAKRWVVERTFAWFACFRRLTSDREHTPSSHEAFILLANISICLNRMS